MLHCRAACAELRCGIVKVLLCVRHHEHVCGEITERATKIHFNKHMQSFMAKRGATQPVVASWRRRLIAVKPCTSGFKRS